MRVVTNSDLVMQSLGAPNGLFASCLFLIINASDSRDFWSFEPPEFQEAKICGFFSGHGRTDLGFNNASVFWMS